MWYETLFRLNKILSLGNSCKKLSFYKEKLNKFSKGCYCAYSLTNLRINEKGLNIFLIKLIE